jgi:hypothetical protein
VMPALPLLVRQLTDAGDTPTWCLAARYGGKSCVHWCVSFLEIYDSTDISRHPDDHMK